MHYCTNFNPDVWGTVSDWFIFGVTALTGYGVYQTLKSQTKTLKLQTKINKHDSLRLRKEIKPVFELKETFTERNLITDYEVSLEIWFTNIGDYEAKNVEVNVKTSGFQTKWDVHPTLPFSKGVVDQKEGIRFTLFGDLTEFKTGTASLTIATITLQLTFTDIKGNPYVQEYFFTVNNKEKRSHLKYPKSPEPQTDVI